MNVKNLFDLNKYSAFLFDCDGTIADSMPVHLVAWNKALTKWNAKLSEAEHEEWAGRPTSVIVGLLNEKYGWSLNPDIISKEKEAAYHDLIDTIKPVHFIKEVLLEYHGQIPFAVVSGSPRDSVQRTLLQLGLAELFETILGAEDYSHGKPAPDCFLSAALHLQVEPSRCLVFEDADLGVQGAQAAGMNWVRVSGQGLDLKRSHF